jgi:predicted dehydrogenase
MTLRTSRRTFVRGLFAAGAVASFPAVSWARVAGANERLRVASIGPGGKGWSDLTGVAASPAVEVVALCDIDSSAMHLGRAAEKYAQAKTFSDWRIVLDEGKQIDAVIVSTPDHMHAPISLAAMALGKHVFCQKPLTHTVHEARQMAVAAKKYGVVTQMGNQIQSHEAYRTAVKIVQDGLLGKVKEVHSWQGGTPRWPRAIERPTGTDPVPTTVQWDLWLGAAPARPYVKEMYHPFNWRGWQDFGTGQLGDFGCHILDPVFTALKLTSPTKLTAEAPKLNSETWTKSATVRYLFPGTEYTASEVPVTWYDGEGVTGPRELFKDIPASFELPHAGSVLIGEKGSLVVPHVKLPTLFRGQAEVKDVPHVASVDHYVQFADACRGAAKTTSNFAYAGPLTETVMLGVIGIRNPGEELQWDAAKLTIANNSTANGMVTKPYRKGWEPAWVS